MHPATIAAEPGLSVPTGAALPDAPNSLAEVLDRILHRGVSLEGNLTVTVAEVDLLFLDLRLLLASVDTVWPHGRPPSRAAPHADDPHADDPHADEPPPRVPPPSSGPPAATPLLPNGDRPRPADPAAATSARHGQTVAKPPASPAEGLVRLVLTLVKLLHDVLQQQAVRRMAGGRLSPTQIENLGLALYAQASEIERLRRQFGFSDRDLDLRLGPSDSSL